MSGAGALLGVRVLDLSRLVAGNVLTQLFADFGADVVKVGPPGVGDPLRTWRVQGLDLWWRVYAQNKSSVTLDLRHPQAKPLLQRLVAGASVVVESFMPGTLERWGSGRTSSWGGSRIWCWCGSQGGGRMAPTGPVRDWGLWWRP